MSDLKLPYQVIARLNNLTEADEKKNIWQDAAGEKFILTKLGFVPAVQHNALLMNERTQRELEKVSGELVVLKQKEEAHKKVCGLIPAADAVGKRSRKHILSIIKTASTKTDKERLLEIKNYLTR